jgi:hypothetical protein
VPKPKQNANKGNTGVSELDEVDFDGDEDEQGADAPEFTEDEADYGETPEFETEDAPADQPGDDTEEIPDFGTYEESEDKDE